MLDHLSQITTVPPDLLKTAAALFVSYISSFLLLQMPTPTSRHVFSIVASILTWSAMFGVIGIAHLLTESLLAYVVVAYAGKRAPMIVFVGSMLWLSFKYVGFFLAFPC